MESVEKPVILLGNEAIAYGLLEGGCTLATSYPGTPASEIMGSLARLKTERGLNLHVEWSINEKVAFETALANSYAGRRSAVSMKQVGLNVAADPLMSSAYTGVKGGFVVIVADDPGPHSSQTEQDTRLFAMTAQVPVLDPASPREARDLVKTAFNLSERYEIPVLLRPTTRICHASQNLDPLHVDQRPTPPSFDKNPPRWAATPKFRFLLHQQLNEKIAQLARDPDTQPVWSNAEAFAEDSGTRPPTCIVAAGVAFAHVEEILHELQLRDRVPLYRVSLPYPLSPSFRQELLSRYESILILEESFPVIETQFMDRARVRGRTNGWVPNAGELLPEIIEDIVRRFCGLTPAQRPTPPDKPGRRPTLCPGCPHRAAYFAIKRTFKKGIYPGDIGCYTLGLNLSAVDTVLCMGAAVSQAAGFYHAYRDAGADAPPIAATIGDSTFFHSGVPALINGVVQDTRFVLVILDNSTTAMTGQQPTPASGLTLDGQPVPRVAIEDLVRACGVSHVRVGDPYDYKAFVKLLKDARIHCEAPEGGIAVVISRRPCLMDRGQTSPWQPLRVVVNDRCKGCGYCTSEFECPALVDRGEERPIAIDPVLCSGCGVCVYVCPHHALEVQEGEE